MDELYDFNNSKRLHNVYGGANGKKIPVMYEGESLILKTHGKAKRNPRIEYSNSCVSEYLGSHIFQLFDIPVQKTRLGYYDIAGKRLLVVACTNFLSNDEELRDFAFVKNIVVDSETEGHDAELSEIQNTIFSQDVISPEIVEKRFWDMFVVDALIGNWDRHNGNWGLIYNKSYDEMRLAPVFDNGSCLYPQADSKVMMSALNDEREQDRRIFLIPTSAIKINGRKLNYFDFMTHTDNEAFANSFKTIFEKVNLEKINRLIDETPVIDDLQKSFYKLMLNKRFEKIFIPTMNHVKSLSKSRNVNENHSLSRFESIDSKIQRATKNSFTEYDDRLNNRSHFR